MMKENLIKIYEQSFRDNRELPALTDYFKGETFSYFGMAEQIARLHLLFKAAGIKAGTKVALVGRNNPHWVMAFMAAITHGAVIVPILQDFSANDIHHIINHSEAEVLFAGDQVWDVIETEKIHAVRAAFSLTDYKCIYERHGSSVGKFCREWDRRFRAKYKNGFTVADISYPEVPNDRVIEINYTSGTTGFTKGVMLTVNNLTANVVYMVSEKVHIRGSRVVAFLPFAHAYGCTVDMLLPLAAGSHITMLGRMPSPKVLLEAMAEVKPRVVVSVPLILEKIYRKQILPTLDKGAMKMAVRIPLIDKTVYSAIRKKLLDAFGGEILEVVIGGAPLNREVEEFLVKIRFPITVGYGMTECGPLISYSQWDSFKAGSCGRVLPGIMEARIDSPDPQNTPGEIVVRGENVMKGYYKNEKATAEVLGKDGWLRTGDMGTIDPDGTLYIRGRSKAMLLGANGQNVYPEEIESKLNNMSCVMESLVVERDGRIVALVVPDYEQADAMGVRSADLPGIMEDNLRQLNEQLAAYERVAAVILYPTEFEKTPKKSIKRYLYNV